MHGECYRKSNGQPYTRKQYIKGKPQSKIAKFNSGNPKADYDSSQIQHSLMHFQKNTLSPSYGPHSHYIPSSSQYTRNAIKQYGLAKGFILGCDRLIRENDEEWIYPLTAGYFGETFKYDPVR